MPIQTATVIIPIFNMKKTVSVCLESILKNGYDKTEVIAIDDSSTDGSLEILRGYANKGVTVIELPVHGGLSSACAAGVARAKGEVVIRTDADTIVPQDWICRFMEHFKDPRVIAVGGGTYGCLNAHAAIARANSLFVKIAEVLLGRTFLFGKLPGANRAVRAECLKMAGNFSRQNDRDLFRRLRNMGRIAFDNNIVVKTAFPETVKELWRRKFLWGLSETVTTNPLKSFRLYFSLYVISSTIGLTLISPFTFSLNRYLALVLSLVPISEFILILFLAWSVSKKDGTDTFDILATPVVLILSELAFFSGAITGAIQKRKGPAA